MMTACSKTPSCIFTSLRALRGETLFIKTQNNRQLPRRHEEHEEVQKANLKQK